jgi:hypothetical protein
VQVIGYPKATYTLLESSERQSLVAWYSHSTKASSVANEEMIGHVANLAAKFLPQLQSEE